MYVPRLLRSTLHRAVEQFPAVLVTGPRQSGKTTLVRQELADRFEYVTFDDPLERRFAAEDPVGFLGRFGDRPVVLDEVQHVPALLSYVKLAIDGDRDRAGRWVLTGSQQFGLMRDVSESLAGRVAILELLPFSLEETAEHRSLEDSLWIGFYPEPSLRPEGRDLWVRSYIQTYLERDVRQLMSVRDLGAFESFIALLAAHHGQTLNMAALSRDLGVSGPSVKQWLSVLEASYTVTLLRPYFRNFGKRLVKAPKVYFTDPALVCALTRQPDGGAALAGPMGGALLEGVVVAEAAKAFTNRGERPDLFYWRSHDGLEVDLLVQVGQLLMPFEVKTTATPRAGHVQPMVKLARLVNDEVASPGRVVCQVESRRELPQGVAAIPWKEMGPTVGGALDRR